MMWLKNNFVFLFAVILMTLAVMIVVLVDGESDQAIGFVVLSTALTAISSVATYMQAIESRRQRENNERPDVAVYFQPANRLMYCIIHNLGDIAATNVRVQFKPSPVLHNGRPLQDLSLFAKSISFLPPREKYWRQLGPSPDVIGKNALPFEVFVEYQSTDGKSFTNKFVVDLTVMSEANDPELSTSAQLAIMSTRLDKFVQAIETERLMKLTQDDSHKS